MNVQTELYKNLMALCESSETFFYKDFKLEDRTYRIFNYRLSTWTEFQKPGAKNCRGTMYEVTDFPVLVSFPMEKFFNYEEGTIDHTKGVMTFKMDKLDGSLISTYLHNGELRLKSKGSLSSEQAIAAMNFLKRPENQEFLKELKDIVEENFVTVNMEYTAPTNRVVVPYQEEKLTIISVRSHNGSDLYADALKTKLSISGYNVLLQNCVKYEMIVEGTFDQVSYVESLRQETEGEGYVIEIVNETSVYRVKVKNHRYLTLHAAKDGINNPKRLFEAVIDETTDDLRSLFVDDQASLNMITEMEQKVVPIYNHMINQVETFYETMKHVDRKTYAIEAKAKLPQFMGMLMSCYLNQPVNYKEFAKKHMKEIFGITGTVQAEEV